jgi:glycosyltransferase involved in cell wall biosynthesis
MDVLMVYQFCTFGGVERAILNRVQKFRQHGLDIKVSVGYLQEDEALGSFKDYIRAHGLDDNLTAFILPQGAVFDWDGYDLVNIIDTPQVFDRIAGAKNVFIECHTAYIQNRQYLKNLPANIRGILVPSDPFRTQLMKEFPGLPPIYVIPNPVSDEFYADTPEEDLHVFTRHPLAYFARLDDLKNFAEAVAIFESLVTEEDVMYFIVGYGSDDRSLVNSLLEKKLLDRSVLRGRIRFNEAPYLTRLVKGHRGIFLSPSRGESFGLSAAEFISAGVPVLLSNIPAHRELVEGDDRFLYELGDITTAREKLLAIWMDWDALSKVVASFGAKFRGDSFYKAWMSFMASQDLAPKETRNR